MVKSYKDLVEFFDMPTKFMNNLKKEYIEKINNDIVFKIHSLKYPKIVSILINCNVNYDDNRFELVELAIRYKNYETLEILVDKYKDSIDEMFQWGFEREGIVIPYDYNRMSRFYIIDKYFDKKMLRIFSMSKNFVKNYIKYKKKILTFSKKSELKPPYKIIMKK